MSSRIDSKGPASVDARTNVALSQMRTRYRLALGLVAALALSTFGISLWLLSLQDRDAWAVNVSGRQRMLSQQIAKHALELANQRQRGTAEPLSIDRLERSLRSFRSDYVELMHHFSGEHGYPDEIEAAFWAADPIRHRIDVASAVVLKQANSDLDHEEFGGLVEQVIAETDEFLPQMHGLVGALQTSSEAKIAWYRSICGLFVTIKLLALVLVVVWVFDPAIKGCEDNYERTTEQRNLLDTIINDCKLPIFWKDSDCRIVGCNVAFAKLAGFDHPEEYV